jgi:hypothetical protein
MVPKMVPVTTRGQIAPFVRMGWTVRVYYSLLIKGFLAYACAEPKILLSIYLIIKIDLYGFF